VVVGESSVAKCHAIRHSQDNAFCNTTRTPCELSSRRPTSVFKPSSSPAG
jgi:hypothetical protein